MTLLAKSAAAICGVVLLEWASAAALGSLPGAFRPLSPANGATGQATALTLSWSVSAGAASYEYCYDTTNDNACSTWTSAGTNRFAFLSGLAPNTSYYWHVRANNGSGATYANRGGSWTFATQGAGGAFTKSLPTNGWFDVPLTATLSWKPTAAPSNYEYCYYAAGENGCTHWGYLGPVTSVTIYNLYAGTTYYWQVRTTNLGVTTYANGSQNAFWSFTTTAASTPFGKGDPWNGQVGAPLGVGLSWTATAAVTRYEYCIDTTDDGVCMNWIPTSSNVASAGSLSPNTTYYWHVRVPTALGDTYADGTPTAFWSFTTTPVITTLPPCNVLSLDGTTGDASTTATVYPLNGTPTSYTVEAWIWPDRQSCRTLVISSANESPLLSSGVVAMSCAADTPAAESANTTTHTQ